MCKINFNISSVTSNRYYLQESGLYISAYRSIENNENYGMMRMKIGPKQQPSSDVGLFIFDSESSSDIKPVFYDMKETRIGPNSADFISSVSDKGTIYYSVMKIGTNRNKVLKD